MQLARSPLPQLEKSSPGPQLVRNTLYMALRAEAPPPTTRRDKPPATPHKGPSTTAREETTHHS